MVYSERHGPTETGASFAGIIHTSPSEHNQSDFEHARYIIKVKQTKRKNDNRKCHKLQKNSHPEVIIL